MGPKLRLYTFLLRSHAPPCSAATLLPWTFYMVASLVQPSDLADLHAIEQILHQPSQRPSWQAPAATVAVAAASLSSPPATAAGILRRARKWAVVYTALLAARMPSLGPGGPFLAAPYPSQHMRNGGRRHGSAWFVLLRQARVSLHTCARSSWKPACQIVGSGDPLRPWQAPAATVAVAAASLSSPPATAAGILRRARKLAVVYTALLAARMPSLGPGGPFLAAPYPSQHMNKGLLQDHSFPSCFFAQLH